jgi:hypothetical protein
MRSSVFDPAHVLGCSRQEAEALLNGRRVTPGEVESVALKHYPWRRHVRDPESYWVTASQAAVLLRTSPQRVKQLLDGGRLPFVTHASGVRLMRRQQIRAIADLAAAGATVQA